MYSRRIAQQCTSKKPLGLAVRYGFGHLLWSVVDGAHTFLVNKPSDVSEDQAPASAYLQAVQHDLCTLRGAHRLKNDGTPAPNTIPNIQHIRCVLDPSMNVKPVDEWDMSFPTEMVSCQPV